MPFRIDVPAPNNKYGHRHKVRTQKYQDYLDDVKKYGNIFGKFPKEEKYTYVGLVLTVTRESINWFIEDDLEHDFSSQKWRDEVYGTAALAQRDTKTGCVGYYRGTNSLHVKRQHQTIEEATHNHNHYRFETEVTPELFASHILNFVKFDQESTHNGTSKVGESKFLTMNDALYMINAFKLCYEEENKSGISENFKSDPFYEFTQKDKDELEWGKQHEGECRDLKKDMTFTMAGLFFNKAEERQHHCTSESVIIKRGIYQGRSENLTMICNERQVLGETKSREKLLSKLSTSQNMLFAPKITFNQQNNDFNQTIKELNSESDNNIAIPRMNIEIKDNDPKNSSMPELIITKNIINF